MMHIIKIQENKQEFKIENQPSVNLVAVAGKHNIT